MLSGKTMGINSKTADREKLANLDQICVATLENDNLRDQTPSLVLLDLVMLSTHGFDVLRTIRGNSTYATMPVLVYSGSDARDDIVKSYKLGANAYIVKPQSPSKCRAFAQSLNSFWLTWAQNTQSGKMR